MIDSDEAPPQSDPMLTKAQDLEEIAAKLLETARKLPPGQDRHNALQEVGRFRARIAALQSGDLRRARRG
jgi:Cdc6-like AAA superfamily ATPase